MDLRTNNGRLFDLSGQPFRQLDVDLTATKAQIDDAFDRAQRNRGASLNGLIGARNALLDPAQRLSCELAFPLDCPASEFEAFYSVLGEDISTEELLDFSDRLWPLARANFIAHVASHRPASGSLLFALVESHAGITANDVYSNIRAASRGAEMPAPALLAVDQGLKKLLEIHVAAAFAGYGMVQDAAIPVHECTLQALATNQNHLIEAIGLLLGSYHHTVDAALAVAVQDIESACERLHQQPADQAAMEQLTDAVHVWILLCRPLLIWNADRPENQLKLDTPISQLRALIAGLCEDRHFQTAIDVTTATREIFAAVPTTIDELAEDARAAAGLFLLANVKQLQDALAEAMNDPGPLIAALERDGFARTSGEPAQRLWTAFVKATAPTAYGVPEQAWKLIHQFTLRLSNRPEAAQAVAALITGLLRYGQTVSANPATLRELRNNLRFMQSFIGREPVPPNRATVPRAQTKKSIVSDHLSRLRNRAALSRKLEPRQRKQLAGILVLASLLLSGFAVYQNPDRLGTLLSELANLSGLQQGVVSLSAQTMPPVGTGQHLEKDALRYCHFQKERLRFIKELTKGPEDARSYNLLIVDYNSRCSDFFYKDEDLKQVSAEVKATGASLQAEARQIVSAWPGHEAEKN